MEENIFNPPPLPAGIKEFSPGEIALLCLGFSPIIIKCNSISNLEISLMSTSEGWKFQEHGARSNKGLRAVS